LDRVTRRGVGQRRTGLRPHVHVVAVGRVGRGLEGDADAVGPACTQKGDRDDADHCPMPHRAEATFAPVTSWSALNEDPGRTGIFLDFDGTLSGIVVDPARARPIAGAAEVLHALAERYKTVAVVSGRPLAFLRAHLDLDAGAVKAFGIYGLETMDGVHPDAAR